MPKIKNNKNKNNFLFSAFKNNLLVIVIPVVVLALVQLVISHHLASLGGKVRQAEKIAILKEQENKSLAEDIGRMGSLARVSSQAQSLGFVRTTQVLHLAPQIPVALK